VGERRPAFLFNVHGLVRTIAVVAVLMVMVMVMVMMR
jgi:hypothetical protein